MIYQNFLG
jgi:hypothetical protein